MNWPLVLSVISILFTGVTAIFSVLAYTTVIGLQNSTHKVQWVPFTGRGEEPNPTGMDLAKRMAGIYDEDELQEHM